MAAGTNMADSSTRPLNNFTGDLAELQRLHGGKVELPLSMEWQNLVFNIGDKQILKGLTGLVEPGKVTGVMGPSGCGKSTLLNVLSGRQRTHGRERSDGNARKVQMKGTVSVSGKEVQVNDFRNKVAYVFQDNALGQYENPYECLDFSAFLRLPAGVTKKERHEYVEQMLKRLHLDSCKDVVVGTTLQKGLSGGELKRTAVGVELISNPRLIFLDEPLSGLDSYNAYTLMESLKDLAAIGVPVLLTLHQPSSEIFAMLDDVMILHEGEACFHGPAENLVGHFEQLGFPCPPNYNPADRVLFIIQQESEEVVRNIKDKWVSSGSYQALLTRIERASDWANAAVHGGDASSSESSTSSGEEASWCPADKDDVVVNKHPKGWCATLWALIKRDIRGTERAWKVILSQAIIGNLFVALVYGVLFFQKARKEDTVCHGDDYNPGACQRFFLVHFAVLSMISINVMFASHAWATEVLQSERALFLRERAGGYYQVLPYILAKTLLEVPLIYMQVLVMLMGAYWLVGLRGNFFAITLEMEALALTSASVMYCLSAFASSRAEASALAIMPQILQFGFSGVLLPVSEIPVFLQWIKWLCPLYYGLGLLGVTEFEYLFKQRAECEMEHGIAWNTTCPGVEIRISALQAMDVDPHSFMWPNLAICFLLFLCLRLLAVLILWRKSRFAL